jgi:hypothetical protein
MLSSDPLAKKANFLKLICRNPRFLLRVVLMLVTTDEVGTWQRHPHEKGQNFMQLLSGMECRIRLVPKSRPIWKSFRRQL